MKRLLAAGILVAATPLAALQQPPGPVFRGGIDIVRLDVSVVPSCRTVCGLIATDFVVTDEGIQQVVESVVVEQLPLSVQLVLDVSGSVVGDCLKHLIAAADGLVGPAQARRPRGLADVFSPTPRRSGNDLGFRIGPRCASRRPR